MGFANSGSALTIANTVELADAIGAAVPVPPSAAAIGVAVPQPGPLATAANAAGARLVNNLTATTSHTFSGVGDNFVISCAQGVSFALSLQNNRSVLGAGNTSNEFIIQWFDSTGLILLDETRYEVNSYEVTANAGFFTVINDQCLGPIARVIWTNNYDTAPAGTPQVSANFVLQTVVTNRLRITEYNTVGTVPLGASDTSGFLLRTGSLPLAATGVSAVFQCAPTNGPVVIIVNGVSTGTANANFRVRGGFGFNSFSNNEFAVYTGLCALSNQPALITQLGSVPVRPLWFSVANIGTVAGSCNVEVWSNPD